ncbi:hypothetical protein Ppa06_26350 [Planomonospora parontospora subsp. parontospora]|uniref:Uncharacterized protein n=2 Tax=Planomonospora parontospora TaxID=58119 RepID=A0AA37BEX3_9ACTN|nr:hypothetical protein [Planomonospora parontospora]GGK59937.1 hypothetical protein GCM10010126_19330 [Planomonospora parontospora]GII08837.1 hypothetical protein Ppa06_26350 [Planomonospora parontospora subsp. parontospora]
MSDTSKRDPLDVTTDGKPDIAKMRKLLRELQKEERERRLAQGRGKPRTRREWEMWSGGVRKRLGIPEEEGEGDDVV